MRLRRDPDKPGCGGFGVLRRLLSRFARRRLDWGGWLEEPPPDAPVREPRRPLPGAPSASVAVEPPTGP